MIDSVNTKNQISNLKISIKAWVAILLAMPSTWLTMIGLQFWAYSAGRPSIILELTALGLTLLIPFTVAYCIFKSYKEKSSKWAYLGIIATIALPNLIFITLYLSHYLIKFIRDLPLLIYTYL
jgi:hypothetical protein